VLERELGRAIPPAYRRFIEVANGGSLPYSVRVPPGPQGEPTNFSDLYRLGRDRDGGYGFGSLLGEYRFLPETELAEHLPVATLLPVARTGGEDDTLFLDLAPDRYGQVDGFVSGLPAWTGLHPGHGGGAGRELRRLSGQLVHRTRRRCGHLVRLRRPRRCRRVAARDRAVARPWPARLAERALGDRVTAATPGARRRLDGLVACRGLGRWGRTAVGPETPRLMKKQVALAWFTIGIRICNRDVGVRCSPVGPSVDRPGPVGYVPPQSPSLST
jgi:hypothetical protein